MTAAAPTPLPQDITVTAEDGRVILNAGGGYEYDPAVLTSAEARTLADLLPPLLHAAADAADDQGIGAYGPSRYAGPLAQVLADPDRFARAVLHMLEGATVADRVLQYGPPEAVRQAVIHRAESHALDGDTGSTP